MSPRPRDRDKGRARIRGLAARTCSSTLPPHSPPHSLPLGQEGRRGRRRKKRRRTRRTSAIRAPPAPPFPPFLLLLPPLHRGRSRGRGSPSWQRPSSSATQRWASLRVTSMSPPTAWAPSLARRLLEAQESENALSAAMYEGRRRASRGASHRPPPHALLSPRPGWSRACLLGTLSVPLPPLLPLLLPLELPLELLLGLRALSPRLQAPPLPKQCRSEASSPSLPRTTKPRPTAATPCLCLCPSTGLGCHRPRQTTPETGAEAEAWVATCEGFQRGS